MTCIVYYDDDSDFVGATPPATRRWGVICVAQADKATGREVVAHSDWYYRREGRWYGASDIVAMMDLLVRQIERIDCLMSGSMTDPEHFNEILRRAQLDDRLPKKTAKYPHERLER